MFQNANDVVLQVTKLDVLWFVLAFVAIMSLIAPILTFLDKGYAKNNKRRISEKSLFIVAALGGALAEFLTMQKIRHKTLHKRFMIGLPTIFTLQICLFIWWIVAWF
ncbi:MAG: DUF1294 domain-containing protein [Clostridia bacterium]